MEKPPNPWCALQEKRDAEGNACYLLDEDAPYILAFNKEREENTHAWINTTRVPEPRLGSINAPVFILQSNPSLQGGNPTSEQSKDAIEALKNDESPHAGLNGQNNWWLDRYGQLARDVCETKKLAEKICSVEYFPYPSPNFDRRHAYIRLPSQNYTFSIIRRALQMKAVIVVTRSWSQWVGAIPELANAPCGEEKRVFTTNSPQCAYITEKNLGCEAYKAILKKIGCSN